MAEFIVSLLIEKIATQLMEEAISFSRVRNQIEWIEGELKRMQCFLKDADAQQDSDERVRNWVADVRDVAYDTEDVIDSYIFKMAQKREKGLIRALFKGYPFVFFDEFSARRKVNKQISRIKMRIHDISSSRSTYGVKNIGRDGEGTSFAVDCLREKRRSYPHTSEEDIVGLGEDMMVLGNRVIHGGLRRSVISIIGMAGLGKTTLAKKMYQSSDVKKHFDCCAWAYVSQEYRKWEILQDLCKKVLGLGKADLDKMHMEDMKEELSNFLQERRFIIVLDDIWEKEAWDDLKAVFPDAKNGSRIIFTTRFKDVAVYADPGSPPYELCLLNEEDSCELLFKKAFAGGNAMSSLPPWSRELGKQIVKKCGGLPLAIVVLGGLLSSKEATYSEWLKVLQSVQWQLNLNPAKCMDILKLSYQDLPYYLKPCFLYIGLFPEDFEIAARKLILLWVAEGFVQPRGIEPLEDVAEDYLEELVGRSMVEPASRKSNGKIKTIRVHDLLRELAIAKAKEDQFLNIVRGDSNACFLAKARRLAIHFGIPSQTRKSSRVRSLLFFDISEPVGSILEEYKLLQVLDLEGVYMALIDSSIGNLIHLRYLDLRKTWLKMLPSSMGNLFNLQSLDLSSTLVDPIPLVIWKMQQLKHVYFSEFREMVVNPPADASLPNLQTLLGICICETSCVEQGLDKLLNLRELGLHGDLILHEEALCKWIYNLKGLQCLKMQSRITYTVDVTRTGYDGITNTTIPMFIDFSNHVHLYKLHLTGFLRQLSDVQNFPPNLTELSLQYCFLTEDPLKELEKLPNLRALKLKQSSYLGKEMVSSSGGFSQLQFLKLSNLFYLERWRIEEGAMCNLRRLEIIECMRLKIVPSGLWPLTTLSNLKLGYMPFEFDLMAQDRRGENWYKLEHVLPM
ncbi:putative disease resistance protein [Citrus sinensis]|nr:putative disease resistance protein At1g50180 [Citrus sinensis]KAH9722464.1 putative disease resistance protein [Citrus sinensis]